MGGCCCSSRKPQLHRTPVYYYCPPLEDRESLTSHDGATSALTAGFLVDVNLETSIPDAYRPPPVPLPYDMVFGHPQSTDSDSVRGTINGSSFGTLTTHDNLDESDLKTQTSSLFASPKKIELSRLSEPNVSPMEEEDCCPICLEEYDAENPRNITKCQHHFHLSCILEWMERSDTCPICDQEMIFEGTFD